MCQQIAFILMGKNSPHYRANKVEYKDKCIVVNARHTFLTGKKMDQKLYRHHTGFPGGLIEIKAKHMFERKPIEAVWRSIKGMLPKNKLRMDYMSKVEIIEEGGHDLQKLGLPEFGNMIPIDYNEIMGTKNIGPDTHKIIGTGFPLDILPEQVKGMQLDLDPTFNQPEYLYDPKIQVNDRRKMKYENYQASWRKKHHRRIRNMAYKYI